MNKVSLGILSGLTGMICWGTAEFFANSLTDNIGNQRAFFWVNVVGFVLNLWLLFFYLPSSIQFDLRFMFITVLAAIAYLLGYLSLYQAFTVGDVSVVSPITSSYAIFTVIVSVIMFGQQFVKLQLPGISLVIFGVILTSLNLQKITSGKVSLTKGVIPAIAAAVFFGLFFWPVNEYVSERTSWIMFNLLVRAIALLILLGYRFIKSSSAALAKLSKQNFRLALIVGSLDVIGILGVSYGIFVADSIIVIPIASAFSLVTVILATIFLKEKIRLTQGIGIVSTITGIVLATI